MPQTAPSSMQSLARGLPSPLAWQVVSTTFDAFVAIDDARASDAVARLAAHGVQVSPSGAAALGGLIEVLERGPRDDIRVGPAGSVLVVATEAPRP
jgi:threonine dehydratase